MNYPFIPNRMSFYLVSAVLVIGSLVLLSTKGLNWGLDFTGGTEYLIRFKGSVAIEKVREKLDGPEMSKLLKGLTVQRILQAGESPETSGSVTYLLRSNIPPHELKGVEERLIRVLSDIAPCEKLGVNSIGPVVGEVLKKNTAKAVVYSCFAILIYMWFQFELRPGVLALLALIHDTIVVFGTLSITGGEMDLTVVAALLTVLGYSLNDSIVVLDRIRENLRLKKKLPYDELVNASINEVFKRTIYTTLTTVMSVAAFVFFGPHILFHFSLVLMIGILLGALSTLTIVCPGLVDWDRYSKARVSSGK